MLLVGGDAGIGKSTLFTGAARPTSGLPILSRACTSEATPSAWSPLVDLLRQILRTAPTCLADATDSRPSPSC